MNPEAVLVEATRQSIELSAFVWRTRTRSLTPEMFCESEAEQLETPAIAAAENLKLDMETSIIPIDVASFQTRKRLALRMLLHPIEAVTVISRFHGGNVDVCSLDEVREWRGGFMKACPTAYGILFTDRESHMRDEILRYLSRDSKNGPVAVLVGVSHLEAMYDLLLDSFISHS